MKEENNQNSSDKKEIILNKDIDLYKTSIKVVKESKISSFKGTLFNELLAEMLKDGHNEQIIIPKNEIKNNLKKMKSSKIKENKISRSTDKPIRKQKIFQKMKSFNKNSLNNCSIIKKNKLNKSSYLNNKTLIKNKYITTKEFKIEKIIFQMRYNTQMGEDLGVIGSINELGRWDQNKALKMTWSDGNIWKGIIYFNNNTIYDFEYKFIFISKGCVKQWENGNNRKFILSQIKGLIESCPGGGTIIHLKNIQGQNIDFNYNDNTLTIICEWNNK